MYEFKVEWYFDSELFTTCGIVNGASFAEATNHLIENFGEKEVEKMSLVWLGDNSNVLCYNDDTESLKSFFTVD